MNEFRTGFVYKPTAPKQWVAGSRKASARFGAQALNPKGQWGKYVPANEEQAHPGVEPADCTVINSLKAWMTLSNFLGYGLPKNASERFSAIMAGVRPPGANPHDVGESIRTWGMVTEGGLPFDEDVKSVLDFYHPDPMDEGLIAEAKKIVQRYELGHEIVFNDAPGVTPTPGKANLLKQALSRGTVCVSVYAWPAPDGQGVYHKPHGAEDEHWTTLIGYEDGEYWLIADSYVPFAKKLSWDYDFQTAETYFLQPNASGIAPNDRTYFQSVLRSLSEKITRLLLKLTS